MLFSIRKISISSWLKERAIVLQKKLSVSRISWSNNPSIGCNVVLERAMARGETCRQSNVGELTIAGGGHWASSRGRAPRRSGSSWARNRCYSRTWACVCEGEKRKIVESYPSSECRGALSRARWLILLLVLELAVGESTKGGSQEGRDVTMKMDLDRMD